MLVVVMREKHETNKKPQGPESSVTAKGLKKGQKDNTFNNLLVGILSLSSLLLLLGLIVSLSHSGPVWDPLTFIVVSHYIFLCLLDIAV
jgi:hypothetical protein